MGFKKPGTCAYENNPKRNPMQYFQPMQTYTEQKTEN